VLKTFSVTDIGMKRKLNQDYIYASEKAIGNLPNLFIVADGMGGHKAGDFASKCTVETICDLAARSFEKNPVLILKKAIETANGNVWKKSAEDENFEGMGTTVVAASCLGKYLQIANVGDSRLYVIGEEITQITRDHSLVEEMIRMGGIDRGEARNHPDKNIITRAIGAADTVDIDFFSVELKPLEKVLMCSDGLTNMLEDEEIRMIVQGEGSIEGRARELISVANERGGKDNISVILIEQSA
jgi:protein phosphatase